MKRVHFNNEAFVLALDAVRAAKKLNWKQLGDEAEVSPSTICRVLKGKNPDVDSLTRLVHWCGVDFKRFISAA